jgi:hypothetical protein
MAPSPIPKFPDRGERCFSLTSCQLRALCHPAAVEYVGDFASRLTLRNERTKIGNRLHWRYEPTIPMMVVSEP